MNGPERSTVTEMTTTMNAVSAIFSASSDRNISSGDMGKPLSSFRPSAARAGIHNHRLRKYFTDREYGFRVRRCAAPRNDKLFPFQAYLDRRSIFQCLIDDAITLGEFEKLIELVLLNVGVDVEGEADLREADRRLLGDAERAAEIEIAFGRHRAGFQGNIDRGGDRFERDAGAGDQSLQQHVARAQLHPRAAGGRMQAGDRQRPAGLDLAGDIGGVDGAFGLER